MKNAPSIHKSKSNFTEIEPLKVNMIDKNSVQQKSKNSRTSIKKSILFSKKKLYHSYVQHLESKTNQFIDIFKDSIYNKLTQTEPFAKNLMFKHFLLQKYYFIAFCSLFSRDSQLLSNKYSPIFIENVLDCSIIEPFSDFIDNFVKTHEKYSNRNYYESLGQYSNLSRARENKYEFRSVFDRYEYSKKTPNLKLGLIINGKSGSGTKSTIQAFLNSHEFEVEHVNLITFDNLREVAIKFAKSVYSKDVMVNLKSAFNLSENYSNSQSVYQSISRDHEFYTTNSNIFDFSNFYSKCQIGNNFSWQNDIIDVDEYSCSKRFQNKKIYLVENIHLILQNEQQKIAKQKISQFLKFLKTSKYPFVFIHPKKINSVFDNLQANFEIISSKSLNCVELAAMMYLILIFEKNVVEKASEKMIKFDEGQNICDFFDSETRYIESTLRCFGSLLKKSILQPCLAKIFYTIHIFDSNLHRIFVFLQTQKDFFFEDGTKTFDQFTFRDNYYFKSGSYIFFNHDKLIEDSKKNFPNNSAIDNGFMKSKNNKKIDGMYKVLALNYISELEIDSKMNIFGKSALLGEFFFKFSKNSKQNQSIKGRKFTSELQSLNEKYECLFLYDRLKAIDNEVNYSIGVDNEIQWKVQCRMQSNLESGKKNRKTKN